MNAESYLRKQGWKGSGHSLDTTGRGIKKPLLIAHKQDQLGLGKKKAAWTTDDQWWMRAFDESLQNIGTGQDSTLNQIRTKGINRGGLYGFFVKGEAIAGTIEDSSASATDASVPPSGASTPPTSASDSEAPAKMTEKKTKRKRADDKSSKAVKKAKSSSKESASVERKIAKLSTKKRAMYEARAATKKQSLDEYIARRIAKKAEKQSTKRATRCDKSTSPVLFFTDLEGDATLPQQVQTVSDVVDTATDTPSTDPHDTAPSARENTSTPGSRSQNVTGSDKGTTSADVKPKVPKWKEAMKEARKAENKAKKTEKKAQKAERRAKSTSKWGANKATNSRWGRIKAEKKAAKEAVKEAA